MNKKYFNFFYIFLISLTFFSCKNNTPNKLSYTENDTIKETVIQKKNDVSWTKEIEGTRLNEKINPDKRSVVENNRLTPEILKILPVDSNQSIYPEYKDFGKLDTRLLNDVQRQIVINFCNELSNNIYSVSESYFDNSYIFNFVFFRNDLINNWKSVYNQDFPILESTYSDYKKYIQTKDDLDNQKKEIENQLNPQINESSEKSEIKVLSESEIDELNKKLAKINKKIIKNNQKEVVLNPIFNSFDIGEPFIGLEIIQIPVRFYCNQGTVDVTLYLNNNSENKIYQITIDRWEKV